MPTSRPYPGTQAVLRAVALLKAFTDSQPERSLTDLARAAGLHKTTAFRMLTALENAGLIVKNHDTDTYRLGPEAIALGGRAIRANHLSLASRPELEALAQKTGETATLEVLIDNQTLILDEVLSHYFVGATPSIGTRWPAHATSTGKVMLADLSDGQLDAALDSRLAKPTVNTIGSQPALKRELARAREQGYAVANEELELGFVAVSAPVRNHEGRVVAAISVGGPRVRLTSERVEDLVPRVVQAADRISKRLGYSR